MILIICFDLYNLTIKLILTRPPLNYPFKNNIYLNKYNIKRIVNVEM